MIYLDSSVALASLFGEPRSPATAFWRERLVSSELLEYEVRNRIHAYGLGDSHNAEVEALLLRVELIDMTRTTLARALQAFPIPVRTLDGLHLATLGFLRRAGEFVELASYDNRLIAGARSLDIPIAEL